MWVLMRKPSTRWVNERPLPACVKTSGLETRLEACNYLHQQQQPCADPAACKHSHFYLCYFQIAARFPEYLSLCICGYALELPQVGMKTQPLRSPVRAAQGSCRSQRDRGPRRLLPKTKEQAGRGLKLSTCPEVSQ